MSYQKQMEELARSLDLRPGAVSHITVSHDDWCPKLRGGVCRCNPDIRTGEPQPNRAERRAQKQGKR